jgi:hypothetical protein
MWPDTPLNDQLWFMKRQLINYHLGATKKQSQLKNLPIQSMKSIISLVALSTAAFASAEPNLPEGAYEITEQEFRDLVAQGHRTSFSGVSAALSI